MVAPPKVDRRAPTPRLRGPRHQPRELGRGADAGASARARVRRGRPRPAPARDDDRAAVAEGDGGIAGKLYAVALGSRQAAAGGLAGIIARTASAPLDRVKLLFQVQAMEGAGVSSDAYTGVGQAFAKIYREEGILAFWRGNGVNVIRVAPYAAAQLSSNDLYKKMLTPEGGSLGLKERLAPAPLAGMTRHRPDPPATPSA